jgi:hypothetical protein
VATQTGSTDSTNAASTGTVNGVPVESDTIEQFIEE